MTNCRIDVSEAGTMTFQQNSELQLKSGTVVENNGTAMVKGKISVLDGGEYINNNKFLVNKVGLVENEGKFVNGDTGALVNR